jgi:hypothetical protein
MNLFLILFSYMLKEMLIYLDIFWTLTSLRILKTLILFMIILHLILLLILAMKLFVLYMILLVISTLMLLLLHLILLVIPIRRFFLLDLMLLKGSNMNLSLEISSKISHARNLWQQDGQMWIKEVKEWISMLSFELTTLSMSGNSFVALTRRNPLQISLKMTLLLKSYACCVIFCFANCKEKWQFISSN